MTIFAFLTVSVLVWIGAVVIFLIAWNRWMKQLNPTVDMDD